MERRTPHPLPGTRRALAALALALTLGLGGRAATEELPFLEKYVLDTLAQTPGAGYELTDRSLGGGDAHCRIQFQRDRAGGTLSLRVWRRGNTGGPQFALLGERIEVRGFNGEETAIFSRDFKGLLEEGIFFPDSTGGNWRRKLRGIPAEVRRIEVTFHGNYE